MITQRIQLSRKRGWRMPENTVKVDRTTLYGNPYVVSSDRTDDFDCSTKEEAIQKFTDLMRHFKKEDREAYKAWIAPLRGKNLACWCKLGEPCHADVLLEIANEEGAK